MTQEEFLIKAKEKNPQFDFSQSIFNGRDKDVVAICSIHGRFIRKAGTFITKQTTCPYCDLEKRKQEFIQKANHIHKCKYDYSKVEYKTNKIPVEIICPQHGSFWQAPGDHLKGWGCDKCSKKHKPTTEEWIDSVKHIRNGIYGFSKVNYKDNKTPVILICPKHGEFSVLPNNFAHNKAGCPKCNDELKSQRYRKTKEQFIKDAKRIHGDLYDYSKVEYINSWEPVCIICKEHGEFWQSPCTHLSGSGCQKCVNKNQTKLYNMLKQDFPEKEIIYEAHLSWLEKQHFDIYFPKYNIAIEYDGQQHFIPVEKFGGKAKLDDYIKWDEMKNEKAIKNNCKLYRIKFNYKDFHYKQLINFLKQDFKTNNHVGEIIKINYD